MLCLLPAFAGVACGEELLCGGGYLAGSEEARVHVGAVRSSLAAAAAAMSAAGVGRGTLRGSMMLLQSLRASAVGGKALCFVHCGCSYVCCGQSCAAV